MARRRPTAHVAHPAQNALFAMTDLPTPAAPRRLFTALFPPPEASTAIDAERQRWPGRSIWSDLKAQPPQYHRLGQFGCRAP